MEILHELSKRTGRGILGNKSASGTEIIKELGEHHVKTGDVIVEVDGEKIDDVSHFKYVLYKHSVGDTIKVKYYRENKLSETTIMLSEAIEN